jgi:hypothetical protein
MNNPIDGSYRNIGIFCHILDGSFFEFSMIQCECLKQRYSKDFHFKHSKCVRPHT